MLSVSRSHVRVCAQITSLFLHWFPACVAWTERWHPEVGVRVADRKSPEAVREWHDATLVQLVLLPCVPYLLWAVLYYTKACTSPLPLFNCWSAVLWRDALHFNG